MAEDLKNEISDTVDDIKEHIILHYDLYKLKAAETTSKISASFVKFIVFSILSLVVLTLTLIATAQYIESLINIPGVGFGIVALVMALVTSIVWMVRRHIIEKPVIRFIVGLFFRPKS